MVASGKNEIITIRGLNKTFGSGDTAVTALSGIDLTIADACLTLTFCQVEGVEAVYVTVEGSEIPYRPIQRLTLEDVLLSAGQESPSPASPSDPAN